MANIHEHRRADWLHRRDGFSRGALPIIRQSQGDVRAVPAELDSSFQQSLQALQASCHMFNPPCCKTEAAIRKRSVGFFFLKRLQRHQRLLKTSGESPKL